MSAARTGGKTVARTVAMIVGPSVRIAPTTVTTGAMIAAPTGIR